LTSHRSIIPEHWRTRTAYLYIVNAVRLALGGAPSVRRHMRECTHCREAKHRFVPATEVLGSFALMTAPPRLREQTAKAFLAADGRRRRKLR